MGETAARDTDIVLSKSQALAELNNKLSMLKGLADALVVTNQEGFIGGAGLRTSLKAVVEAVKFQTGPRLAAAKEELERAKQEQEMFMAPAKQILETVDNKLRAFQEEEKRLARIEQDRINAENARLAREKAEAERRERDRLAEEARKKAEKEAEAARKAGEIGKREAERRKREAEAAAAAERQAAAEDAKKAAENVPTVKVKANVPTVAGAIKNQTYWKFRIVNPALIPLTFRMPDEKAIGQMVRDLEDKAAAEKQCPGIEVWSEG